MNDKELLKHYDKQIKKVHEIDHVLSKSVLLSKYKQIRDRIAMRIGRTNNR